MKVRTDAPRVGKDRKRDERKNADFSTESAFSISARLGENSTVVIAKWQSRVGIGNFRYKKGTISVTLVAVRRIGLCRDATRALNGAGIGGFLLASVDQGRNRNPSSFCWSRWLEGAGRGIIDPGAKAKNPIETATVVNPPSTAGKGGELVQMITGWISY